MHAAIPLFEQAIEQDPAFAAAYVGLADAHVQLGLFSAAHPRDVAERARELCRRALDLDPELTEARATLATIHAIYDWDWGRAETELRSVLERSPDHTKARQALAVQVLAPLGRFDQAIAVMQAALAVDAISIPLRNSLAFVLHFARRSQEALTQVQAALELAPDNFFTRIVMTEILCDLGRPDEGIDVILADSTQMPTPHTSLALCYARAGRIEEARASLARLLEAHAGDYAPSYFPALVHIGLGDPEQALDLLERAVEERVPRSSGSACGRCSIRSATIPASSAFSTACGCPISAHRHDCRARRGSLHRCGRRSRSSPTCSPSRSRRSRSPTSGSTTATS